jgi:hypothetical protein
MADVVEPAGLDEQDKGLWFIVGAFVLALSFTPTVLLLVCFVFSIDPTSPFRQFAISLVENDLVRQLHSLVVPILTAIMVFKSEALVRYGIRTFALLSLIFIAVALPTLAIMAFNSGLELGDAKPTLTRYVSGMIENVILYLFILLGLKRTNE